MTDRKDGGPAFPVEAYDKEMDMDTVKLGLSIRDWFAGQALAAVLQLKAACKDIPAQALGTDIPASAAYHAYAIADAMLAEREKD